jgi:hypothetical protein
MYKIEDFIEEELQGEFLYIHKDNKDKWFGKFPNEESYYIPMCSVILDTRQEVVDYLNKNLQ